MIHFKLDENVPLQVGEVLRRKRFSVSSFFSEKISGIKDNDLLRLCIRKEYVIVTLDKDFTLIQKPHQGIIIFRLQQQGVKTVVSALHHFLEKFDVDKSRKMLIIVGEETVRIRAYEGT